MKLLLPLLLLLPACTVNPTIRLSDGTIATTGGSFLSKSAYESARLEMPNGTVLEFTRQGKDETEVAKAKIRWDAAAGVIGASGAALNSTTKTITDAIR